MTGDGEEVMSEGASVRGKARCPTVESLTTRTDYWR